MNQLRSDPIRSMAKSLGIFAVAGFMGALFILLLHFTIGLGDITDQLASLIWPTQMLATYESTMGKTLALLLAMGSNVLVFALIGGLLGLWNTSRNRVIASYLVLCAAGLFWALFEAGFDARFLNIPGLLVGFLFYAAPVLLILRRIDT